MMLHPPTLLLGSSLSTFCLFIAVVVTARFVPRAKGVIWWGYGGLAIAFAMVIFAFTMLDPSPFLRIASHIGIAAGIAMFGYGTASFSERPFPALLYGLLITLWLTIAVVGALTGLLGETARVMAASLAGGALLLHAAQELRRAPENYQGRALQVLCALVLLTGLFFVLRGAVRLASLGPELLAVVEPVVFLILLLALPVAMIAVITDGLAQSLAVALRNASREARIDPLTGVQNRRSFDRSFQFVFRQFKRYGRAQSLILFDLDRFKAVNDGHGHTVGDAMLVAVGRVMQTALRDVDQLFRVGGDEFAILLPETAGPAALAVAQRLCAELGTIHVPSPSGAAVSISASFGVTECRAADTAPADVYDRADRALYFAKNAGRARAELY